MSVVYLSKWAPFYRFLCAEVRKSKTVLRKILLRETERPLVPRTGCANARRRRLRESHRASFTGLIGRAAFYLLQVLVELP